MCAYNLVTAIKVIRETQFQWSFRPINAILYMKMTFATLHIAIWLRFVYDNSIFFFFFLKVCYVFWDHLPRLHQFQINWHDIFFIIIISVLIFVKINGTLFSKRHRDILGKICYSKSIFLSKWSLCITLSCKICLFKVFVLYYFRFLFFFVLVYC